MSTLENPHQRRRRSIILIAFVTLVLLLLGVRLFHLQILRGPQLRESAQRNLIRPDPLPALRGCIFAAGGELLAGNRVSFGLRLESAHPAYRDPSQVRQAVGEIAAVLAADSIALAERALRQRRRREPLVLAQDLQPATLARLVERLEPIPGLHVERGPMRWYPHGRLAAHVLGYVGEVREEELGRAPGRGGYRPGAQVGRAGVEAHYEEILRGVDGETYITVDAVGRKTDLFAGGPPRAAVPGADLTLTLDARLQAAAESLLAGALASGQPAADPGAGVLLALDPWSGALLACASQPDFDPNRFATGWSAREWAELRQAGNPLLNRAVQAGYPPGSIFKIASTLIGLSSGELHPATRFAPCTGGYLFGDRVFHCWKDEGHGTLALRGAFAASCDVYYYQLAERLGLRALLEEAHRLKLDARTGIDLPGEMGGLVPTRAWYRTRLGHEPPEGHALNLIIGQGEIIMTPLALAAFVAAVVSDGAVRRPFVVRTARARDGSLVLPVRTAEIAWELPLGELERGVLRTLLEAAVADKDGTGRLARLAGVRVGGKTGTAQNPHGEDHALFVGVAPIEQPEIVALAVLERRGHGGSVAAPIVGRLLATHLGVALADAAPDRAAVIGD